MNTAEVFLPLTHDTQLVVAVRKGSEELNLVLAGPNAGLMMYTNTLGTIGSQKYAHGQ